MSGKTAVGLFAGVGGIELGLHQAGFSTIGLCEYDEAARSVLADKFPQVPVQPDVRTLQEIPPCDVLSAGFPCQDLSQAGGKAGITGTQSGLVQHLFRLLDGQTSPEWLLIENVSYMLKLNSGRAMAFLVGELERRGYRWAYRVVDARAFGIPQRRQRVILLASRDHDPRGVLFADEAGDDHVDDRIGPVELDNYYGFYWTEGLRGLGWARDAVPTVKGGSLLGIPSPPAVWDPKEGFFGTPSLADVERLQGFPAGWTSASQISDKRNGPRWKLMGNAVCVPMSKWVGSRLLSPGTQVAVEHRKSPRDKWPIAAWGEAGALRAVDISMFPTSLDFSLRDFLRDPLHPLSRRASAGFLARAQRGNLRFAEGFLESLGNHIRSMT